MERFIASSLFYLLICLPGASGQHCIFSGDGCQVKIPFLDSCKLATEGSVAATSHQNTAGTFTSIQRQLSDIQRALSARAATPGLLTFGGDYSSNQREAKQPVTRNASSLEETLEKNCWDRVERCELDTSTLRVESVALNKHVLTERRRADAAERRAIDVERRLSQQLDEVQGHLDECDKQRAEKDRLIVSLQISLEDMESSVVIMQEEHEVNVTALDADIVELTHTVRAKDIVIVTLRAEIENLKLELAKKRKCPEILRLGPVTSQAPLRDVQKEAPNVIKKPDEGFDCGEDALANVCGVLGRSSRDSDSKCVFERKRSADFNWLSLDKEELTPMVKAKELRPVVNLQVCSEIAEYFYLDFSSLVIGQTAILTSLEIRTDQSQCFSFWYSLHYSYDYGKFYTTVLMNGGQKIQIWEDSTYGTDSRWRKAFFSVPSSVGTEGFRVRFTAESNGPGYVALNSMTLTDGKCTRQ